MRRFYLFFRLNFFAVCAGLLPALSAPAQTNLPADKDSLRQFIDTAQGKAKLDAYMYLAVAYFFESKDELKMDTMLAVYAQMDAEARRQGNIRAGGILRYNILSAFRNVKKHDEVIRRGAEYLDFLEEKQAWSYYFNVYRLWICSFTDSYQYGRALAESQKMYDKARSLNREDGMANALYTMADIYGEQDRNEDRLHHLRQAAGLMKGKPDFYPILANLYYDLCQALLSMKRYDEALPELEEFEKVNQLYEESAKREVPTTRANLFGCYARLYNNTGDIDKAEYYTDKLDSIAQTAVYATMVCTNRAKIFLARKQYDKALEMANRAIELETAPNGRPSDMILKAFILSKMGKAEESFELANEAVLLKDSLNRMEYNRQLDGLRTEYEVDRIVAEKERTRNQLLFALAGCFVLALSLGIWMHYTRLVRRKNRSLYLRIQELTHIEKEAEERLLKTPEEKLRRKMQVFRSLSQYMQEKTPFTDPALNRKMLAVYINSNESYLAESIREATGETVSTYISGLRLQYALKLLDEHPDMTFDSIAIDSGYGSYSPFFRSFTKKYGITPSEYRKLSGEKRKKPNEP